MMWITYGFDLLNYPCCHGRRETSLKMVLGVGVRIDCLSSLIGDKWNRGYRSMNGVYSIHTNDKAFKIPHLLVVC